ncbi:unnamed protein product, partial [Brenthis ino]
MEAEKVNASVEKPEEKKTEKRGDKDNPKPEEKKENTDVTKKKTENEAPERAPDLLNMLSFIAEMQNRRRNVATSLEKLSASGYGPKEWKFSIEDKLKARYRVVSPGNRAQALVIREPLVAAKFTNIDTFLQYLITCAVFVVDRCLILYREPSTVSIGGELASEPEDLGIPLTQMCELEPAHENICSSVQRFCVTQRMRNPNYSLGRVAEGLELHDLREAFFSLSRDEMRPFREIVIAYEHHIRQERPEAKGYKNLLPNDVLHIAANPFALNSIFDHLPMASHYYSELV